LASYSIATVLIVTVVGVAWARSRSSAPVASGGETARALGADVYARECRGCHGSGDARGRSMPALRGRTVDLFASDGGREYLIDLLLDGRVRHVENSEPTLVDSHPGYAHLSDVEVAAVLNHMLSSWGNDALLPERAALYGGDEVAARRPR
jgi:mono/diheme cytochrome c family protein